MEKEKTEKLKVRKLTTYEKKRLEEKKQQHKENFLKNQKIQGQDDKGKGFECSEEIIFTDFEVGKVYKKKLSLINVQDYLNSMRIEAITEEYAKCFEIEYKPSEPVAKGNGVKFKIIFFPQTRQDIETFLPVICETGRILIPIFCKYKRTEVEAKQSEINFGQIIVGEEKNCELILKNKGGLETFFEIRDERGKNIKLFDSDSLTQTNLNNDSITPDFFRKEMNINYKNFLPGYSEQKISFKYSPQIGKLGIWQTKIIIHFEKYYDQKDIEIFLKGESVDLPIKIAQNEYDLGVCIFGEIYRVDLRFENKGKRNAKLEIRQPKNTEDIFQFLMTTTNIKEEKDIVIKLKIEIKDKIKEYQNYEQGFYEEFKAKSDVQKEKIYFKVKFLVTENILDFPRQLDFQNVFENTSSVLDFILENKSLLIQKIYFNDIPEHITFNQKMTVFLIKPKSKLFLKIIYKAKKLGKEEKKLRAKIIIGKQMTKEIEIYYKAQVLKCPLKFSAFKIDFPTSQEEDERFYILEVINKNINKEEEEYYIQIQQPPEEFSGIKISPEFQKFNKKQQNKLKFAIEYFANFRDVTKEAYMKEIQKENFFIKLQKELEQIREKKKEELESKDKKEEKIKKKEIQELKENNIKKLEEQEQKIQKYIDEELRIKVGKFKQEDFIHSLGGVCINYSENEQDKKIDFQFYKWLIPVLFKPNNKPDTQNEKIFLEINTCVRSKVLECSVKEIDFGMIPFGERKIEQFDVINKSQKTIKLKMDLLPTYSGFSFVGILKEIEPGQKVTYSVAFEPFYMNFKNPFSLKNQEKNFQFSDDEFQTKLRLYNDNQITINLKGKAIKPDIEIVNNITFIDMGNCLIGEKVEKKFIITNKCKQEMFYKIQEKEKSYFTHEEPQLFLISPYEEKIPSQENKEITVVFQPQKENENYFLRIQIFVERLQQEKFIFIKGCSFRRQGFLKQYFEFTENEIKKFIDQNKIGQEINLQNLNNKKIYLLFKQEKQEEMIQRLIVGSTQTKKNTSTKDKIKDVDYELTLENPKENKYSEFFKIENAKGKLQQNSQINIKIIFNPPKTPEQKKYEDLEILKQIGKWIEVQAKLNINEGYFPEKEKPTQIYDILLKGYLNYLDQLIIYKEFFVIQTQ